MVPMDPTGSAKQGRGNNRWESLEVRRRIGPMGANVKLLVLEEGRFAVGAVIRHRGAYSHKSPPLL
jgi:hypothetical protein